MMVDTGGIEIMNADAIAVSIRQQAQIAIKEADVILSSAMRVQALLLRMLMLPVCCVSQEADCSGC